MIKPDSRSFFSALCSFSVLTRIPFKKQLYLSNFNTCKAIEFMWDKTGFPFKRPGFVWHAFLEAILSNLAKYCRPETLRLSYLSLSRCVKGYPLFLVNNLPRLFFLFFFFLLFSFFFHRRLATNSLPKKKLGLVDDDDEAALVLTNQIKLSHSRCNFGWLIIVTKTEFSYNHSALIMFWGVGHKY